MKKKLLIIISITSLMSSLSVAQEMTSERKRMEDSFIEGVKTMAQGDVLARVCPDTTVMSRAENRSYYVLPGEKYIIDDISSATYYNKVDRHYVPLCDNEYPKESIANRLLLPNRELPDGTMNIEFQKYKYGTDSVSIQFKQFQTFCRHENYEAFVGIESIDDRKLVADMFLYNYENKWLHIINLDCPVNSIANEGLVVSGKAWLFIPTNNLKELMGKELPKDFMNKLVKNGKK